MKIETTNSPVTESDLDRAEETLGRKFPDDYRSFLLAANGGVPLFRNFVRKVNDFEEEISVTSFYSLAEFLEAAAMRFDDDLFERSIFIIATTHCPVVVCMSFGDQDNGSIFTFTWDDGAVRQAVNLNDFLHQLHAEQIT